jgi:CDP-glucose 4,6-dehydratase
MNDFWRQRAVFLTGHTGFKGAWLCSWLSAMQANVVGYALAPDTTPNLFALLELPMRSQLADVRDAAVLREALRAANPHIGGGDWSCGSAPWKVWHGSP